MFDDELSKMIKEELGLCKPFKLPTKLVLRSLTDKEKKKLEKLSKTNARLQKMDKKLLLEIKKFQIQKEEFFHQLFDSVEDRLKEFSSACFEIDEETGMIYGHEHLD
jgi:predicted nuclease with TOPRIM domain